MTTMAWQNFWRSFSDCNNLINNGAGEKIKNFFSDPVFFRAGPELYSVGENKEQTGIKRKPKI